MTTLTGPNSLAKFYEYRGAACNGTQKSDEYLRKICDGIQKSDEYRRTACSGIPRRWRVERLRRGEGKRGESGNGWLGKGGLKGAEFIPFTIDRTSCPWCPSWETRSLPARTEDPPIGLLVACPELMEIYFH
jgi:hypothetical protein